MELRRGTEGELKETQRFTDAYAHTDATLGHTHSHTYTGRQTIRQTCKHRHVEYTDSYSERL